MTALCHCVHNMKPKVLLAITQLWLSLHTRGTNSAWAPTGVAGEVGIARKALLC